MVVIRLSRGGAKGAPFYSIVIADKRSPRDGRFIERVGHFNPTARGKEICLNINKERIDHWVRLGAQPSQRVAHLIKAFVKQESKVIKTAPSHQEQKIAQQKASKEAIQNKSTQKAKDSAKK